MRYLCYGLVLILAVALQTTSLPGWDLVLLLGLVFALAQGAKGGAFLGFAGGLMLDFFVGHFVGLRASVLLITCWLGGILAERLYKENLLVRFFIIAGGTLFGQIVYTLGTAAFGHTLVWSLPFYRSILFGSIFNGVFGLVIFRPIFLLNKRLVYWDELLKRTG